MSCASLRDCSSIAGFRDLDGFVAFTGRPSFPSRRQTLRLPVFLFAKLVVLALVSALVEFAQQRQHRAMVLSQQFQCIHRLRHRKLLRFDYRTR
jgi:hypothetical protein